MESVFSEFLIYQPCCLGKLVELAKNSQQNFLYSSFCLLEKQPCTCNPWLPPSPQAGVDRANARASSNAQRVQKWAFLDADFSVPGGELGPTLKMKRHVVLQKNHEHVERFYA